MKTLVIVGSGDLVSHSLGLGQAIESTLRNKGVDVELINLHELHLPLYDRKIELDKAWQGVTKEFIDKSYAADSFVWITPIYHNSFSSVLKNALDWQHSQFPGKVVGLASNGGNRSPQAVDQMMLIARAQHLVTTTSRVCTQEDDYDDNKLLNNANILNRVEKFCSELIELTNQISS